jgi:hypothetical protein
MLAKTVKMTDLQKQTYINNARAEYIERELYFSEQRKQERENERYILEQDNMFKEQEEEEERQKQNKVKHVKIYDREKLIQHAKQAFYSRYDESGKVIDYYSNLENKIKNAKKINNDSHCKICKINYSPLVDNLIKKQSKKSKKTDAKNNAKQKIAAWEKSGWYM